MKQKFNGPYPSAYKSEEYELRPGKEYKSFDLYDQHLSAPPHLRKNAPDGKPEVPDEDEI